MKERYLGIMEKAVNVYTIPQIEDYIASVRKDGLAEHGFARLTSDIGILLAHGRVPHLRALFVELMDLCAQEMPTARQRYDRPGVGNDFVVKEITLCLLELTVHQTFPAEQLDAWKAAIASVDPWAAYTCIASVPPKPIGNWAAFAATSDQLRIYAGLNGDPFFVDNQIASQLFAFDENGMYRDPHEPMVYDLVTRLQLAVALHYGYDGAHSQALREQLLKGSEQTPLMQSVTGEIPFGGRSNQFMFNEAFFAGVFEYEARLHKQRGEMDKARQCKGAALLAINAIERYLDTEHMYHIKNGHPFAEGYGCEGYGYFNKYMVTAASFSYLAYVLADDTIEPAPSVAEIGGYIHSTSAHFHKTFMNFGGYFLEYDTNADFAYDANGLGRVHRVGAPSPVCMSVPVPPTPANYKVDIENPGPMSLCGGVNGEFSCIPNARYVLAEQQVTADFAKLVWEITLPSGKTLTEESTVTREGVTLRYTGEGEISAMLPAFEGDGYRVSTIAHEANTATITYEGWQCRYTASAPLTLTEDCYANRNGHYRTLIASDNGAVEVKIVIEKA